MVAFWSGVAWVTLGAAFALLALDVASGGVRAPHQILSLGVSTVLLVIGVVAHLAGAAHRGLLGAAWPGLLFPLAFALFHFGSLYESPYYDWYDSGLLAVAWNLSVVCLLSWMVGYSAARGDLPFRRDPAPLVADRVASPTLLRRVSLYGQAVFWGGMALQLTFFLDVGFSELFLATYKESKQLITPNSDNPMVYVGAIGMMMTLSGIVIATVASGLGRHRTFPNTWFAAGVGLHALSLALQGDRSELSVVALGPVLVRHYWVRPISMRQAVAAVVLVFMLFAGLKMFRIWKQPEDLVDAATDLERLDRTASEMGYTLDTVVRSLELVPDRFDYFAGSTYAHAVARALPNLSFERREWGFVSSVWLMEETTEKGFVRAGGLGFSVVAEAFINFGIFGAPLCLAAIGALHGRAERAWAGATVEVWWAMLFLVLEISLFMHVRNTAVLYIRAAIWMSTFVVTGALISRLAHHLRRLPS
jgi:hypothetical protein